MQENMEVSVQESPNILSLETKSNKMKHVSASAAQKS